MSGVGSSSSVESARPRLIFWILRGSRTVIRDGGGHNRDVRFARAFEHGAMHLLGGANRNPIHAVRNFQIRRPADQNHVRAATLRSLRQRVTHFARGAIGEKAHRVKVLASGPGGDQYRLAREIVAQSEHFANFLDDGLRGGQAARAGHAASQVAFIGIDDVHAARAQRREIFLRRGVLPHVDVHGRRHDDGSLGGEIQRGEEIVGDAVREFSENVGGGGRHKQQVDSLRHGDVFDGAFHVRGRRARRRRTYR